MDQAIVRVRGDAVALALVALASHLPRYQRSLTNYARLLIEPDEDEAAGAEG